MDTDQLVQTLLNHMIGRGAKCEILEDGVGIHFDTDFEGRKCQNTLRMVDDNELVLITSMVKMEDRQHTQLPQMLEVINEINTKLFVGCFTIWSSDGVIVYRASTSLFLTSDFKRSMDFIVFHAFRAMRLLRAELKNTDSS